MQNYLLVVDENNQQKRRILCEKLQDVRDKQKKQNTTAWMRLVTAKIVTAQLKGYTY